MATTQSVNPTEGPTLELIDSYQSHLPADPDSRRQSVDVPTADAAPESSYSALLRLMVLANTYQARTIVDQTSKRLEQIHYYDGGFTDAVEQIVKIVFYSSTVLVPYFTFARPLIEVWLRNKATRSMVFKHGSIEIRVTGSNDLNQVIEALSKLEVDKVEERQKPAKRKSLAHAKETSQGKKPVKKRGSPRK